MANPTITVPPVTIVAPYTAAQKDQRQKFLNGCSEALTAIVTAGYRYKAWLSSLAIAYSQAWSQHRAFSDRVNDAIRLSNDIVFASALAFLPAIGGGLVADVMKKLVSASPAIDAGKDSVKALLRTLQGTAPQEKLNLKPFPDDPFLWQSQIELRVNMELGNVSGIVQNWQNSINNNDPSASWSFDPVDAVVKVLTLTDQKGVPTPLGSLNPVNVVIWQAAFERGWLAGWIDQCSFSASSKMSPAIWNGFFGGGGVRASIVDYGQRLGLTDVDKRLNDAYARDYAEHNARAIRSGHGLI